MPFVERLAYFPWDLNAQLATHDVIVFVDVETTIATNFEYAGRDSVNYESVFIFLHRTLLASRRH